MRWVALGLLAILLPTPVCSEEIKIGDLQGLSIQAVTVNQGTFRRGENEGPGRITFRWNVKIAADGVVDATMKREVESPRGKASLDRSFKGPIGHPDKVADGHFVWVLKDDSLTLLRVLEVGGQTATFKFTRSNQGWSCALQASMAKEVGAGNSRTIAAHGGKVTIIGMKQVSSTCKMTRT